MHVYPFWGTMDVLGPKGLVSTFRRRRMSSLAGAPAKVRTKLEECWELHRPLRRAALGVLPWNACRIAVWRERTIAAGSPRGPMRTQVEGSRVIVNSVVTTGRARGLASLVGWGRVVAWTTRRLVSCSRARLYAVWMAILLAFLVVTRQLNRVSYAVLSWSCVMFASCDSRRVGTVLVVWVNAVPEV